MLCEREKGNGEAMPGRARPCPLCFTSPWPQSQATDPSKQLAGIWGPLFTPGGGLGAGGSGGDGCGSRGSGRSLRCRGVVMAAHHGWGVEWENRAHAAPLLSSSWFNSPCKRHFMQKGHQSVHLPQNRRPGSRTPRCGSWAGGFPAPCRWLRVHTGRPCREQARLRPPKTLSWDGVLTLSPFPLLRWGSAPARHSSPRAALLPEPLSWARIGH